MSKIVMPVRGFVAKFAEIKKYFAEKKLTPTQKIFFCLKEVLRNVRMFLFILFAMVVFQAISLIILVDVSGIHMGFADFLGLAAILLDLYFIAWWNTDAVYTKVHMTNNPQQFQAQGH